MKQSEGIKVRGFFRVQVCAPDDPSKVIGDSGYLPNAIVNVGFQDFLCALLGNTTGSKQVTHAALGTGGAPAVTTNALPGEVGTRTAVTVAVSSTSKTVRFAQTFASGWHTSASAHNISNIGLYNSLTGGQLFAGNTYASSSCASNQAVNTTYDLTFS